MSFCYMRHLFRELRSKGLGSQSKPMKILTSEGKKKLWATGVLSPLTPKGLLNVLFFYNDKTFFCVMEQNIES